VAIVIPSYRVKRHVMKVLDPISDDAAKISVVNDKYSEPGQFVLDNCCDHRDTVLFHEVNPGVGGAVITGYKRATQEGAAGIVKIDGDGQMDPALISNFAQPILEYRADYTRGNRVSNVEDVRAMPFPRIDNALL